MAEVEGQGGVERTPFALHGLTEVLESRAHAAEVLRNTEAELRNRVQTFLQAEIGKCRHTDHNVGNWSIGDLDIRIEGENVVISGVPYFQYGELGGKHHTGTHIITLLEDVGLTVSRQSDAHHAPLVIRVPLAEFSQLTGVEEEKGYDDGGCGVLARARSAKPVDDAVGAVQDGVASVGGQAMEAVGFPVAAAGRGGDGGGNSPGLSHKFELGE